MWILKVGLGKTARRKTLTFIEKAEPFYVRITKLYKIPKATS